MWIEHIFLGFVGLTAGAAVAAGTFAFLIMLNILPRIIGKSHTGKEIYCYENAVMLGGTCGSILSVFLNIRIPFGSLFLCIYGIGAGFFVGCLAVALAEILRTFPIMFRRLRIKTGLCLIMVSMALGKMGGSLFFFLKDLTEK